MLTKRQEDEPLNMPQEQNFSCMLFLRLCHFKQIENKVFLATAASCCQQKALKSTVRS